MIPGFRLGNAKKVLFRKKLEVRMGAGCKEPSSIESLPDKVFLLYINQFFQSLVTTYLDQLDLKTEDEFTD